MSNSAIVGGLVLLAGAGGLWWFKRQGGTLAAITKPEKGGGKKNSGGIASSDEPPAGFAPSVPVARPSRATPASGGDRMTPMQIFQLAGETIERHGHRGHPVFLTQIAWAESRGDPSAINRSDPSYGLMQVTMTTARGLIRNGYRAVGTEIDQAEMYNPAVSMYFASALIDEQIRRYGERSSEWHYRAYNGGPGWERNPSATEPGWRNFQRAASEVSRAGVASSSNRASV